jgi:primosomal protein N''
MRPVAPEIAAREVFARHIAVFTRLSSTLQISAAKNLIEPARPLVLENRKPAVEEHQKFFAGNLGQIQQSVQQMLTVQKGADPFGLNTALSQITSAEGAPATVEAHADLLERLSANLTMLQLDRGDRADIRQMMAWQRDLFSGSAELSKVPAAAAIVRASQKYIADWDARRARENEYPRVLRELLQDFRSVAGSVGQEHAGLAQAVDGLERELGAAPEALEHAHHEFLLRLDSGK